MLITYWELTGDGNDIRNILVNLNFYANVPDNDALLIGNTQMPA
jgi:hypothetical protein